MFGLRSSSFDIFGTSEGHAVHDDDKLAYDAPSTSGLLSGTCVATEMGWRPVEALTKGDQVLTFDAGLQRVTKVDRERLLRPDGSCPETCWPLKIPAGALGNRQSMKLLPDQTVMIESDVGENLYGDPFSLIPAVATEGVRGVIRVPPEDGLEIVTLHFEQDQVVFAQSGALLFCPAFEDLIEAAFAETNRSFYSILSMDEARFLAVHLDDEDPVACTYHPQGFGATVVPA